MKKLNVKKQRRANGEGCISYKASRNKYEASVTIGYQVNPETNKTKRITKFLGYFDTEKEARLAIAKFDLERVDNKDKKDTCLYNRQITFEKLYYEWSKEFYADAKKSVINGYVAAFKALESLHKKPFQLIRAYEIKKAMLDSGKNYHTLKKALCLLNKLYNHAKECDLIDTNYAALIKLKDSKELMKNPNSIERRIFLEKHIKMIMNDKVNEDFADTIKFLIFTGVRVSEMLDLKRENVNLENNYFKVVDSKTEAGLRIVPIHPAIREVVKKWYKKSIERNIDYLFSTKTGKKYGYDSYRIRYWDQYFEGAPFRFLPHDARHTFTSALRNGGVPDLDINKMVGHAQGVKALYYHPTSEHLNEQVLKMQFSKRYE